MNLRSQLDQLGVSYQWLLHDRALMAQKLAQEEHVSGKRVIKPVLVRADNAFVLCALPASYYIDMDRLGRELGAREARIVDEKELQNVFPECELGAEPPMGWLFGVPTVMDDSLCRQEEVVFQAGTHEEAVSMSLSDYMKVARPKIAHFARPKS
jgi:Ala-tRNA(Pro) deacylase